MPRPRAIAALTVLVVAPVWLAVGHEPAGQRARHTILSIAARPLRGLQQIGRGVTSVVRGPRLAADNERLRRELAALRQEPIRLDEASREVARLKTLLQLKQTQSRPAVAARIVGRDATPWFRTVLVDAGRGVPEGAAVVVERGLVGQVSDAGPALARVLLVTDPRFRVGALIQRSRAQGIALGTVRGRCYVTYITRADALQVGDVVLTSGVGGFIPKGLVIGQVARVEQDPSGLYWQAEVTPVVDPSFVEEVLCLP